MIAITILALVLAPLALFVLANLWPFSLVLPIMLLHKIPLSVDRRKGIVPEVRELTLRTIEHVGPRGLASFLAGLSAPLVMLLVLPFVPRSADRLPRLFEWWDNDVSINGDQAEGAETYYAPGHDRRSFWARYVWLGLRNRASRLSQMLGKEWVDKDAPSTWYGTPGSDNEPGWNINVKEGAAQFLYAKRFGPLLYKLHWGYKIWSGDRIDHRPVANLVATSMAFNWRRQA
jgi:hypothetical protein